MEDILLGRTKYAERSSKFTDTHILYDEYLQGTPFWHDMGCVKLCHILLGEMVAVLVSLTVGRLEEPEHVHCEKHQFSPVYPVTYQGNLKSTRKARWSPFLSLYFWHKLIRLEPRKMRGGGLKFSQSLVMAPD